MQAALEGLFQYVSLGSELPKFVKNNPNQQLYFLFFKANVMWKTWKQIFSQWEFPSTAVTPTSVSRPIHPLYVMLTFMWSLRSLDRLYAPPGCFVCEPKKRSTHDDSASVRFKVAAFLVRQSIKVERWVCSFCFRGGMERNLGLRVRDWTHWCRQCWEATVKLHGVEPDRLHFDRLSFLALEKCSLWNYK